MRGANWYWPVSLGVATREMLFDVGALYRDQSQNPLKVRVARRANTESIAGREGCSVVGSGERAWPHIGLPPRK